MSRTSPIRMLARHLRLRAAEQDLAYLEARAPVVIAEQRARVARLRDRAGLPPMPITADTVRRAVERAAKAEFLA
jgi:hypothetical protein